MALYVFSKDVAVQDKILAQTRSGACMVNDILLHFSNSRLPFGGTFVFPPFLHQVAPNEPGVEVVDTDGVGVGDSGLGAYHGKLTFDTFSHRRAVVRSITNSILDLPLRYPPYTPTKVTDHPSPVLVLLLILVCSNG